MESRKALASERRDGDERRQDMHAARDGYAAGGDLTVNIHYPPDDKQMRLERVSSSSSAGPGATGLSGLADVSAAVARARFFAALKPSFRYKEDKFYRVYEAAQVDRFLESARMMACKDMAELQGYLAVTQRVFKVRKGGGYKVDEFDSFMREFDKAIATYIQETAAPTLPGKLGLSAAGLHAAAETARARFIALLGPSAFSLNKSWETKRYTTYDVAHVDRFLATARMLAYKDVTDLQAYLALTPRFRDISRGRGYSAGSIDSLMKKLDEASGKYAQELSLLARS